MNLSEEVFLKLGQVTIRAAKCLGKLFFLKKLIRVTFGWNVSRANPTQLTVSLDAKWLVGLDMKGLRSMPRSCGITRPPAWGESAPMWRMRSQIPNGKKSDCCSSHVLRGTWLTSVATHRSSMDSQNIRILL